MKTDNKPTFTVEVDDNFHFMNEDERWTAGTYGSLREALGKCLQIVGQDHLQGYQANMTATELYESYTMMGDDPFIAGPMKTMFSAWDYAQQLAEFLAGHDEDAVAAAEESFRAGWRAGFLAFEKLVPDKTGTRILDLLLGIDEEEDNS
ncbi:MAG: hypothetical protein WEB31_07635 [Chthoniobacterales bacterium]